MHRRTFLAAALATPLAAARSSHVMQYHLSCGAIGVKADQRQAIDYAARFAFDVVDADSGFLATLDDAALARLRDDMKSKNVGWAIGGLPVEFRKDDAQFAEGMKQLPPRAKALQRAGVTAMTTWVLPMHPTLTYRQNFQQHARRLREIAGILGDQNLRFGLEFVGPRTLLNAQRFTFVHSLPEMRELVAEIARPNVGLVVDSWHWYTAGDTAADLLALKPSDIVSVDLNDAPKGIPLDQQKDGSRELPAATGVIDVKTFLSSLKQIGYTGPVRAEPFNEAVRRMPAEQALQATHDALDKAFAQIA